MTHSPNTASTSADATAPEATVAETPAAPVKRKRGQKEIFRLEPWQAVVLQR